VRRAGRVAHGDRVRCQACSSNAPQRREADHTEQGSDAQPGKQIANACVHCAAAPARYLCDHDASPGREVIRYRAKTNKAMDPANGPATPAEGRARLETAHTKFADACRQLASRGANMRTTIFGTVRVEDYVRFMELHTRHHGKQMGSQGDS
jgi:hypothetical protein